MYLKYVTSILDPDNTIFKSTKLFIQFRSDLCVAFSAFIEHPVEILFDFFSILPKPNRNDLPHIFLQKLLHTDISES